MPHSRAGRSLLLVDEYAHTNVPGSRHPKRWQDIDELLAAGIDVWTTLNIQHLESLNDVVQKITKVRVRETVPDTVFDKADEIVLVDFPPDELLKRLAEGKVYVQDTAARAVENFFKPQNLTALRELALRRAAERIDADLIERMQAQAIEGPWAAGERILACIGPDPISPTVVRAAKRLADLMDAPWIAVTVERPGTNLDVAARQRLDEAMKLAESLGAETQTLTGTDLPAELLRFAKFENVTQIVIGRSRAVSLANCCADRCRTNWCGGRRISPSISSREKRKRPRGHPFCDGRKISHLLRCISCTPPLLLPRRSLSVRR